MLWAGGSAAGGTGQRGGGGGRLGGCKWCREHQQWGELELLLGDGGNLGSEVAKCWIKHRACWACWPGTWKVRFETRWAGKRSRRERPGRLFGFPTTLLVRCLLLYKNWCNNTSQKTTFSPTYFEKVPSLHTLQHPQWLNNFEWNISSTWQLCISDPFSLLSAWDATHSFGLAGGSITAGVKLYLLINCYFQKVSVHIAQPSGLCPFVNLKCNPLLCSSNALPSQFHFSCRSCGLLFSF